MAAPQRIILARHGVTDFTASERWDGRGGADPGLNADGRAQADDLAARFATYFADVDVSRVISSSLSRARQTAEPVASVIGRPVDPDPAWDELAFGEWDGRSWPELRADHPNDVERFMYDETFRVPGGESHVDLHARVRPAFERLLQSGETVLVVSHWGPIMSVLSLLLGIDLGPARRLMLAPTSLSSVVMGTIGPRVEFVNDLGTRGVLHP